MIDTPEPRPAGDSPLIPILERSSIVQRAERLRRSLDRVYRQSRFHAKMASICTHWEAFSRPDRLRAGGFTLITAAVVHVGFLSTQASVPHWRQLVIPVLAMAEGALLSLMARGNGR